MNHNIVRSSQKTFPMMILAGLIAVTLSSALLIPVVQAQTTAPTISQVSAVPSTGTSTVGEQIEVFFTESHGLEDLSLAGSCKVNDVEMTSLQNLTDGLYKVVYTVEGKNYSRAAGMVPVYCTVGNASGTAEVLGFTDNNTLAIDSTDYSAGTTTASTTTGTIGGTVEGGVTPGNGVLTLTSIEQTKTVATADGTYENGWRWIFHVTVPTNEDELQMKFANWINNTSSSTIATANNMRISSAQAPASGTVPITAANTYSNSLTFTSDLNSVLIGRQVEVVVEMRVPVGSMNGAYSSSYGIRSF